MSALLIIDAETTGLDPRTAGIIELAAILLDDGREVGSFSRLCWPGYQFISRAEHWQAMQVSGISGALLLDQPPVAEVARDFVAWMIRQADELPMHVTSYNAPFDQSFLAAHAPYLNDRLAWSRCIMERARRHLDLYRWPSLSRACQEFGIERNGHRALSDARAAAEVWRRLEEASNAH